MSRKKKKKGKHQDRSRDDDDDEDDNSGEGRTLTVRTMKRKPSIQGLMPVASKKEVGVCLGCVCGVGGIGRGGVWARNGLQFVAVELTICCWPRMAMWRPSHRILSGVHPPSLHPFQVTRLYNFGDVIAATDFSTILKAKHRNTGQERAVKVRGINAARAMECDLVPILVDCVHAHFTSTLPPLGLVKGGAEEATRVRRGGRPSHKRN